MSDDDYSCFSHIIHVPGDVLAPRKEFAKKKLGVSDRTAARAKYPTTYVGNAAYVALHASFKMLGDSVKRGRRAR